MHSNDSPSQTFGEEGRAAFLFYVYSPNISLNVFFRVDKYILAVLNYYRISLSDNDMLRDFFLGFIKIHILHHAAKAPVYGLWLIEELGRHGYKLSPGTLYPILHRLMEDKFLKSYSENVGGKIRKYYLTTAKGIKTLSMIKEKINELVEEVMERLR